MSGNQSTIMGGGVRIGQAIQSPVDLEALYPGEFMRLDGRDVLRSAVSSAFLGAGNANFPAGVFTSTARTLPQAPNTLALCAGPSHFIAAGRNLTNGELVYSADGVSWTALSLTTAWTGGTVSVSSIIYAGARYIAAETGLGKPAVCSGDPTSQANWSATTNGFTTNLSQGLAYSASLGIAVGIQNGSGTVIKTLADAASAWVNRSHATARDKFCVTFTGQKFIVLVNNSQVYLSSSDGATWVEQQLPYLVNAPCIASDGNGTVVVVMVRDSSYVTKILVSNDHGATWNEVTVPFDAYRSSSYSLPLSAPLMSAQYINGKFVIPSSNGSVLFSATGRTWQVEPVNRRGALSAGCRVMAYKSGIYVGIDTTTSALSATEDTTKFRLPAQGTADQGAIYARLASVEYQSYVKVA